MHLDFLGFIIEFRKLREVSIFKNKYKICNDYTIIYIKRNNGDIFECYIDTEDLQRMIDFNRTWCIKENGDQKYPYASYMIDAGYNSKGKKKYSTLVMQRFILGLRDGSVVIDHINHNRLDNRKSNLRIIKQVYNTRNRTTKNSNNKCGVRNVFFDKRISKYVVQLQINGKNTILGKFIKLDEAAKYAEIMRNKYYGTYAGNG